MSCGFAFASPHSLHMSTAMLLQVNGSNYDGWSDIRVTRGIEQVAGSFEFSTTDQSTAKAPSLPIRNGDKCTVFLGNQRLISGFVDDRNVTYNKDSHDISISGRDATGDLVDCSVNAIQIKGSDLLQIAKQVCAPFGIEVAADADVGAVFLNVNAEDGQTAFELLSTLAAHRGVLLVSDGLGGLLITNVSRKHSAGRIVFGENIEACTSTSSSRDRHSEYTAKNQAQQNDFTSGETATQSKSTAKDKAVKRYRPLTIHAVDSSDLQKSVNFERNIRAGRSFRLTYTVSGWFASGSTLWEPNTLVSVTDPNHEPKLDHTYLLISTVAYVRDENGTSTELTLIPESAFDVLAIPEGSESQW